MAEHLLLALQIMDQAAGEVQEAREQIPPLQLVGMAGSLLRLQLVGHQFITQVVVVAELTTEERRD